MERKDLEKLEKAGLLFLSEQFPSNHTIWPDGYMICKPKSAGGNSIGDYGIFENTKEELDAPSCCLHEEKGKYIFSMLEYMTWPIDEKSGDFRREYSCLEDAMTAILNYYFGNPTDMYRKFNDEIFNEWKSTKRPINEILKEWRENHPISPPSFRESVKADSLYIEKVVKDGKMWRVTIRSSESSDFIDEFNAATEEKAYQNGQRMIDRIKNSETKENE